MKRADFFAKEEFSFEAFIAGRCEGAIRCCSRCYRFPGNASFVGVDFGFLKVFGWPAPNPTILDALLLPIAAIALVVYRKKYPKPTKDLPKGWFSKDQLTEIEKRVAIAKRCKS